MAKVTLKQIAERAGVSINTVSLALRDMPNVNHDTRARICGIAAELGYYAHKSHRTPSQKLGLISTGAHLKDSYFYMAFQKLFLGMAYEHGYQMMVFDNEYWDCDPQALRRWLTESEISGVLILGDMEETLAANIVSCGLPVVAVGTRYHSLRVCTYIEDNTEAAYQAVQHLYTCGCRKMGFIGDPMYSTAFGERYDGFRSALRRFGLPCDPQHLLLTPSADDADIPRTIDRALDQVDELPDAFFCANDYLGVGAAKALFLRGVSVPGEVSLVGVDNNPLGKMALPSLTSIDVHCRQQAELSIRKLISFVCGEEYDPLRFLVPTELVQGDSVKQA